MYIIVGHLGSSHGVQGWIKLRSFTEPMGRLLEYKNWWIGTPDRWEPVKRTAGRQQSQHIVVKLEGCDTPEQVKRLTGQYIAVKRSDFSPLKPGEYYWSDLEGMKVVDQCGVMLGIVSQLLETGSNDVLIVKGEKEHAIPYLSHIVLNVDTIDRIIQINRESL